MKYVTAENAIIGTQNTVKSPAGEMTFCHGNVIYPPQFVGALIRTIQSLPLLVVVPYTDLEETTRFRAFLVQESHYGMDGNDAIRGGNTSDIIFGNNGDDILAAGLGPNFLTGGGGSMLSGGGGNDLLIGGGGHDVLIGGPGHDKFDCKGESDLILDFNPEDDIASNNCILAT